MTERRHALAMARLLVAGVEEQPHRLARRLLLPRIRWAAAQPHRAAELGVLELVERAREEHLASLDADGGLAALCVAAEEVLSGGCGPARPRAASRLSAVRRAALTPAAGLLPLPAPGPETVGGVPARGSSSGRTRTAPGRRARARAGARRGSRARRGRRRRARARCRAPSSRRRPRRPPGRAPARRAAAGRVSCPRCPPSGA